MNSGSLRIYRVNELDNDPATTDSHDNGEHQPSQRPVDLLREEDKFSKRAIQQLAIVKEANILVSLSDNYVSIHDLQSYALQEKLERTRGATAFAITSNVIKDKETDVPALVSRLAVAVKRKILLWTWQDMELVADVQDIALPATIKSLTWVSATKLIAGMDPGFTLVDVDSHDMTDISKPATAGEAASQNGIRFAAVSSSGMGYMGMSGWVPKPLATKLNDGQILLAKDVNTLFIDDTGKPLERRQIPWATPPEAIGYSYPFMLSLQQSTRGILDIRSPETLTLLQAIPVPNATIIHVPQPNISLAHAGRGFLVASDRCVWRMAAKGYESQTQELVGKRRYDEAISLLRMLEDTLLDDKENSIREIQMEKGTYLFEQQKYRPALDLFADAAAPPERVIALYPSSIAGSLSCIPEQDPIDTDPGIAVPEAVQENHGNDEDQNAGSTTSPKKNALGKLKPPASDSDAASIRSNHASNDAQSSRDQPPKATDKRLEGDDLRAAILALCSFLAQSRVQIQKHLSPDGTLKTPIDLEQDKDAKKIPFRNLILLPGNIDLTKVDWQAELVKVAGLVDTTLFRAYMQALPSLAGPLFRLDNFCDPLVVEEKLYESGRYNDLIDFLHGKRLHRDALELLEKFGRNQAAEEVMTALRGPARTVGYLQQLPPEMIDIILQFAEWPIRTDPDKAMNVFLADTENAENLPRDRVLAFLNGIESDLAVKYLEHIIDELGDSTPDFHQSLVDSYLTKLKSTGIEAKSRDVYKDKLETFLRKSTQYNKGKTFRQLPADAPDFYESRAIVLSAMGNHKQALSIYVYQIRDPAKAEAYCTKTYLSSLPSEATPNLNEPIQSQDRLFKLSDAKDDPQQSNIYTVLLGLYLQPPPGEQVRWPPALDLLSKHGARLPASGTLAQLPDSLAVGELERYFRGRIRNANSVMSEERIVRGLEGVRRVEAEKALLLGGADRSKKKGGRSRRVVVREDDHCKVCFKRFGSSAVRVYPDDEVVHYGLSLIHI